MERGGAECLGIGALRLLFRRFAMGAGFGSHIHVLGPQGRASRDPEGWPLRGHRKIAPGDFLNLWYGSSLAPKRKKEFASSTVGESWRILFCLNLVAGAGFEPTTFGL